MDLRYQLPAFFQIQDELDPIGPLSQFIGFYFQRDHIEVGTREIAGCLMGKLFQIDRRGEVFDDFCFSAPGETRNEDES